MVDQTAEGRLEGGHEDAPLLLEAQRQRTVRQIGSLTRDFDSVVASCEADAYDDEHDPEGHTIAFERQQLAGLLRDARAHLVELDLALERLADGTYGRCGSCRNAIAAERLASRPATRTCVACAP